MVELCALGGLRLRDSADGHEILSVLARAKPSGLLLYLALSSPKVSHSRNKLFELLWPGSSTERARKSLNHALHVLRRGLGPGVIGTTEGGELFLEDGAVWCDVAAFDEALASGHSREALELYVGHLWDPAELSDCSAFERWLDGERQRLLRLAVGAAVTLAEELARDGSFVVAAQWLRQARDWAPYDEAVVRPLLKLLYGMGERAAAVTEYDAYEKHLAADLELAPSTELSELIEEIRSSTAGPEAAGREPPVLPTPDREDKAFAKQPQGDNEADPAPETTELTASIRAQPRASWRTRGRAAAAIVVLGAIAAVGASVIRNGRGGPPELDPTRVLVDLFQNETGDPSLDLLGRMATDRVTAGLTYSSFVDVVSLGTQVLSNEPGVPDTGSGEGSGRLQALARANGTGTVVWGSYYLQGDNLHFLAHVTEAATGEELATIESVRGPVDDPVATLEQLRDRVMTTLATLTDPWLANWMRYASQPPTFEAYTEFVQGIELYTNQKPEEAVPHFLRAAALDSDFTMASLWAAFAYEFMGWGAPGDSILEALNGRRGQMVPLDRLLLDYQLAARRSDTRGALEAIRQVVAIAPGSEFLRRAGNAALRDKNGLGNISPKNLEVRLREAIEFYTQADPDNGWLGGPPFYWSRLANFYHYGGDHEPELEAVNHVRQLDPESTWTLWIEMRVLAASGRVEELEVRILEAVQRDPWQSGFGWFPELRGHGYPAAASDLADRTLEWFEGRTSDWRRDLGQFYVYAKLLSVAGRWDESQEILEDVLKAVPEQNKMGRNNAALELAYVLAMQGHRDQAFSLVLTWWPNSLVVRAWVEAALGEPERAMELLREYGYTAEMVGPHGIGRRFESLRDYPPLQEFLRSRGKPDPYLESNFPSASSRSW